MISASLAELLVRQIASELAAHANYMAISVYFRRNSLDEWGKLFHRQAIEEAQHAGKIMSFLLDVHVPYDLPAIPAVSTQFASAEAAIQAAAASEAKVSGEFRRMAEVALTNQDSTGFQFLQWFIEEQVEEEAKMAKLLDLVRSGVNLFQAQPLLSVFDD
jgi:ferritin